MCTDRLATSGHVLRPPVGKGSTQRRFAPSTVVWYHSAGPSTCSLGLIAPCRLPHHDAMRLAHVRSMDSPMVAWGFSVEWGDKAPQWTYTQTVPLLRKLESSTGLEPILATAPLRAAYAEASA